MSVSDEPPVPDRPEFHSEFYVHCEDPDCYVRAYRFNGGPADHWHFIGSPDHPAETT